MSAELSKLPANAVKVATVAVRTILASHGNPVRVAANRGSRAASSRGATNESSSPAAGSHITIAPHRSNPPGNQVASLAG
jgi:hypothetical protein